MTDSIPLYKIEWDPDAKKVDGEAWKWASWIDWSRTLWYDRFFRRSWWLTIKSIKTTIIMIIVKNVHIVDNAALLSVLLAWINLVLLQVV